MNRSNRTTLRYSTLVVALLAACALPAFAADAPCLDANGNPVPGDTNYLSLIHI